MSDTVISEVVQQMQSLPASLQEQVLAYVRKLTALAQRGIPGEGLLRFAGLIPADELQLMRQAIQEDCEQVGWREPPGLAANGQTTTFTYDSGGRRVKKMDAGGTLTNRRKLGKMGQRR